MMHDDLANLPGADVTPLPPLPPPFVTMGDCRARPELLRPPPAVVERFAYAGCVTLYAAAEKTGKSTLSSQVAAAVSSGSEFLGEHPPRGQVLWLALDEPLGFLVRRLDANGADDAVAIVTEHSLTIGEVRRLVDMLDVRLLVVDTFAEWTSATIEDSNSADQVTPALREFRRLAQETGAGVVLLHHTGRSGQHYRGSGAIGAGVDLILTMTEVEGDPKLRRMKVKGRIGLESYAIRFDGTRYHLDEEGRERTLDERITDYLELHPEVSLREVQREIGGKAETIARAVDRLLDTGHLVDAGTGKTRRLKVAGITGNQFGGTSGSTSGIAGNHEGSTGNQSGSTREAPVIPALYDCLGSRSIGRSGITAPNEQEEAA